MPSTANGLPATGGPSRTRSGRDTLLMLLGGIVSIIGLALIGLLSLGQVVGQEFDPTTFTRREFTYNEIPVLGWQISRISRRDVTSELESYLTSEKMVAPPAAGEPKRWDLVVAKRGVHTGQERIFSQGNARILCEYLDARDADAESAWLNWSKAHPQLAKVVWPAVARVARQQLYVLAPELLTLARNASNPRQLQEQLTSTLAARYIALGHIQQQLNQHALAVECFTHAVEIAPNCAEAFASRATSQAQLGKAERAAADRMHAEQLGVGGTTGGQSGNNAVDLLR